MIEERAPEKGKCPSSDRPWFSPAVMELGYPVIDISNLDYKAYRHKLVESTLRERYDNFQPPGDVVLNSLHLNSADSVIGIRLNDRYDHSLFDFVEEYYDVGRAASRKKHHHQAEHPFHPLDHFLTRSSKRPRTVERETEMIPDDECAERESVGRNDARNYPSESVDLLKAADNNGNSYVRSLPRTISIDDNVSLARSDLHSESGAPEGKTIPVRSRKRADKAASRNDAKDNCPRSADASVRKRPSRMARSRSASSDGASAAPKIIAPLSRAAALPARRRITTSPRPKTSTGCLRGFTGELVDQLQDERRRTGKATARRATNFLSVSSSEIASICSDSSKHQDGTSCRSRESSISPTRRARPPWLLGNREISFNRKYGNIAKVPARPGSARDSDLSQKLTVPRAGRSREPSSAIPRYNSALTGPTAAGLISLREREIAETSVEQREEIPETLSGQRRDESKDVAGAESNERRGLRLPGARVDSQRERISANRISRIPVDNAASRLSAPRTQIYSVPRSPRAVSADAARAAVRVAVTRTSATKEPRLTVRSGDDDAARRKSVVEGTRCSKSPFAQDRRGANTTKLNCGGRQRPRGAEGAEGAPPSPKIELSAEASSPVDDTDKRELHVDGRLASREIGSRENIEATVSDGIRTTENATETRKNYVRANSTGGVTRSKVPKIIRNPRTRPAGANDLPESRKPAAGSRSPARGNANAGTKSGSSGTKLNTRSNGTVDKMKCDETSKGSSVLRENSAVEETAARGKNITRTGSDEQLKLPRHDSKVGLAMNSALRRYIKLLKRGLLDRGNKDGIALASLSLAEAVSILSEQRMPLSPDEIRELQDVLSKIERNPELLCTVSLTGIA